MCLTYEQGFFEKLGFEVVDKETLPLKVWSDCVAARSTTAATRSRWCGCWMDVPVIESPTATPTPRGVSIPVLPYED